MEEIQPAMSKLLSYIEESVKKVEDQRENPKTCTSTFDCLWKFWGDVKSFENELSERCQSFFHAYREEPYPTPKKTEDMLKDLMDTLAFLNMAPLKLPVSYGRELHNQFCEAVITIFTKLKAYALHIKQGIKIVTCDSTESPLRDSPRSFSKSILKCPRNNTLALANFLSTESSIIDYAFMEFREDSDADCLNNSGAEYLDGDKVTLAYSAEEKEMVKKAVKSMQTVTLLYKRSIEALEECPTSKYGVEGTPASAVESYPLEEWERVDFARDLMKKLPEHVENFSKTLHPPLSYEEFADEATKLFDLSIACLEAMKAICAENSKMVENMELVKKSCITKKRILNAAVSPKISM